MLDAWHAVRIMCEHHGLHDVVEETGQESLLGVLVVFLQLMPFAHAMRGVIVPFLAGRSKERLFQLEKDTIHSSSRLKKIFCGSRARPEAEEKTSYPFLWKPLLHALQRGAEGKWWRKKGVQQPDAIAALLAENAFDLCFREF